MTPVAEDEKIVRRTKNARPLPRVIEPVPPVHSLYAALSSFQNYLLLHARSVLAVIPLIRRARA